MAARVWPGRPYPLGATFDGVGVNFAVFSETATRIEVCLFEAVTGAVERERLELHERTGHVFHGYVPGLKPRQLYGLRAYGRFSPDDGLWHNPNKLLVDPYAQAIANEVDWSASMHAFVRADYRRIDVRDNAPLAPKCVIVDDVFAWGDDRPLRTPWNDTVIYELHVKGFTKRHPGVPEALRGTYAGLASPAALEHLKHLGVTAVELMPVHEICDEQEVRRRGLVNYWGYNTLGFFAPAGRYASSGRLGEQVDEFKSMVKTLHAAGIEVILDVVYNHTAEGDHEGPLLSLRGLDNQSYYRVVPETPRLYKDYTGCGNSLNMRHPQSLKLVMDSLRYWVTEMHVDGFRFDLASSLARELHDVDRLSAFFDIIHQDPILSRTKLIAEPWDVGEGGYQVGNFPVLWTEWNGRYRDAVRRYWKGDAALAPELAYRLTGSSDLYEIGGRKPTASINFVVAHDGFTLRDLVSYSKKHNEANGEKNKDGSDYNDSDNHGAEGDAADPAIRALRARQKRNFLTTLVVSQGVPMLCSGDELDRTQCGNNNAYCQDSELSWLDWELDREKREHLDFVRRIIAFRHAQPVLRRRQFFSGGYVRDSDFKDIAWFRPDGCEMRPEDWQHPELCSIGVLLGGDAIPSLDERGEHIEGHSLLILTNAGKEPVDFVIPAIEWGESWDVVIDTTMTVDPPEDVPTGAGERYRIEAKTMVVMRLRSPGERAGMEAARGLA